MKKERRYVIQSHGSSEVERISFAIDNMQVNKAYGYAFEQAGGDPDGQLLRIYQEKFLEYRKSWREQPRIAIEHKLHHESFRDMQYHPLCVDIETASICDLACPFCYRQWIATPDKLIKEDLYKRVIDQCAKLGVPSVKLNWRGEPLLHPKLPQFIDYAKRAGILETIINTNAVTLTEKKSRDLIEAGLDLIIYSFDGGTKETYEKMRVGRFKENHFESVYNNIRRFAHVRHEMGAKFPRTKIQMILTMETYGEQEAFFELFSDFVDDVSVKAYTERGGKLPDLDKETQDALGNFLYTKNISKSAAYWRDLHGALYISSGRLPCEQPFQRLMISYDGRVSMCCYDFGIEYPIGYVDSQPFQEGDRAYQGVLEKARCGARGFEHLSNIKMPKRYIQPLERVKTLQEIWHGDIINEVRKMHIEGRIEEVPVCKRCPFKETYLWVKADLRK